MNFKYIWRTFSYPGIRIRKNVFLIRLFIGSIVLLTAGFFGCASHVGSGAGTFGKATESDRNRQMETVQIIPKSAPIGPGNTQSGKTDDDEAAPGDVRSNQPATKDLPAADYVLGVGDILQISTWKDEALSKVLPILPDGMIDFPLIGRLKAEGKTVEALKQEMTAKLSRYVSEPLVDISVQQANSMLVFLIGRVNQPGRYPIYGNMTVLQALAMAGGLTPFAKKNKIQIIREKENETQIFRFNYSEVIEGVDSEQNIRLVRGDVIVAP